jgi:hypothetical protein
MIIKIDNKFIIPLKLDTNLPFDGSYPFTKQMAANFSVIWRSVVKCELIHNLLMFAPVVPRSVRNKQQTSIQPCATVETSTWRTHS